MVLSPYPNEYLPPRTMCMTNSKGHKKELKLLLLRNTLLKIRLLVDELRLFEKHRKRG